MERQGVWTRVSITRRRHPWLSKDRGRLDLHIGTPMKIFSVITSSPVWDKPLGSKSTRFRFGVDPRRPRTGSTGRLPRQQEE